MACIVQVELTSESDLFFYYTHTVDQESFQQQMQEEQRFMVELNEYPSIFLRMLNSCIQAPQAHIAVLLVDPFGQAKLDFIQV